jgi:hypothetical protein
MDGEQAEPPKPTIMDKALPPPKLPSEAPS